MYKPQLIVWKRKNYEAEFDAHYNSNFFEHLKKCSKATIVFQSSPTLAQMILRPTLTLVFGCLLLKRLSVKAK